MKIIVKDVLICGQYSEDSYNLKLDNFYEVDDLRWGYKDVGNTRYFVFRGTANSANALRDLQVFPAVKLDGFLTHRGFAYAMIDLISHIMAAWSEARFKGMNVIFTGHSFGATIAALFTNHFGNKDLAITFGCPAMHFWFSSCPEINHFRVVCNHDPVPMIPLVSGKHTVKPGLVLEDDDFEWIDVDDHAMPLYNERLKSWAETQEVTLCFP